MDKLNMYPALKVDKSWTLFLDRDGVINKKLHGDYVKQIEDFEFLPGVIESIGRLNKIFGKVILITNQQGIGKGLMQTSNLENVHDYMCAEIQKGGGNLDAIYYCPDLDNTGSVNRKPESGMALKAKNDFPYIDFSKTIMVGDSLTDMEFGRRLNLKTVLISEDKKHYSDNNFLINYVFRSLKEFSEFIYESY